MAWVDVIPAEDAKGALKEVYDTYKIEDGTIFSPLEVMTLNARGLRELD